jgi:hypothetical protein
VSQPNQITNLKKTNHRISSVGGVSSSNQISTSNALLQKQMNKKQAISPNPTQQQYQNPLLAQKSTGQLH